MNDKTDDDGHKDSFCVMYGMCLKDCEVFWLMYFLHMECGRPHQGHFLFEERKYHIKISCVVVCSGSGFTFNFVLRGLENFVIIMIHFSG